MTIDSPNTPLAQAALATAAPSDTAPAASAAHEPRGLLARLLSLSVFYKVLIANSAIVLVGAVAGTAITTRASATTGAWHGAFDVPLTVGFAVAGLALTFILNALVLRAALSPLERLRAVVEAVRRGDISVRAQPSPLDDTQLRRLIETLNTVLDEVGRYQEQVHALSGRLIYAHEDERQRIARELHDDTGQMLTLLLIRLNLLESQPGAEAIAPQLVELRGIVSSAIDQVRRLALNLRPPTIDQLGFYPSLRSLVTTFAESTGIETTLRLPRQRITLAPEDTLAVYRIVQEALTNAAKHAHAHCIAVTVEAIADELRVTVTDDGRGFIPDSLLDRAGRERAGGAGVGLFGMEERARLAGGALEVRSAPGHGASVTLRAPLNRAATLAESAAEDDGCQA
ncbi:MAG TPA: ATP-binding protein [Ktedonobacterales bacterium]